MLEPILWSAAGILSGVLGASFVQGFINARKKFARVNESLVVSRDSDHSTNPEIMVKLIHAANGKLLEVSTKKPHAMAQGHWEWEHEMYIVQEGQKLSEAVSMVMLLKGLEK